MQERQAIDKAVRVDKVAAAEAARRIDAARRRAGRPVTSETTVLRYVRGDFADQKRFAQGAQD